MPRVDKSSYTDKQKRQAGHIEDGYKKKGASRKITEACAWATVNKLSGGGKIAAPVGNRIDLFIHASLT
jgi:hypothetical protein